MIRVVGFFYITRISGGKTTSYMLKTMPERNLCEQGNLNPRVHSYLLLSPALWVEWERTLEMRVRAGYNITLKCLLYVQQTISKTYINGKSLAVILLQTVMVSPGTHLVKNQSRNNKSQLKKNIYSPKLKMLRPLCNQTVNLTRDSKTLY